MGERSRHDTPAQRLYAESLIGTLVYAVVLGFFDDYTDLLAIESFSTLFLAAAVLQLLTWLTFRAKDLARGVATRLVGEGGKRHQVAARGFAMWLVLFFSKFVFLEVIDLVFGDAVDISSFVAVLVLVATTTLLGRLEEVVYARLGAVGSGPGSA